MPASGAQEEKKMPKGHHWKNTRARDPLGWGGGSVFVSKGHGSVAGQWPEHSLLNPNLSVGKGLSLLSESKGGGKLQRLRSRCQTTLLPAVGASLEMK